MAVPHHIVVVGTSAGGMEALTRLLAPLPASLPAAVLVVQHLAPSSNAELLVARLATHTALVCRVATHQAPLLAGHLYLAPPDRHLLVKENHLLVTDGPHENNYRPAADALFRSAAVAFDSCAIGVVLTGMLYDGTAGLDFIRRCGGTTVVQDPAEAEFPSMPESALHSMDIDYVLPVGEMAALLVRLVSPAPAAPAAPPVPAVPVLAPAAAAVPPDLQLEAAIAERVVGTADQVAQLGSQVPLTCPDCGGSLWQMEAGPVLRYRCHTGHAFVAEALAESSRHALEESLWVALRMLEERKNLLTSMTTHANTPVRAAHTERVEELKRHINRLREFMLSGTAGTINN